MIFSVKISSKVFYKLVVSCLMVIAKHARNTQNSKFMISLQYLEEERSDKVNSLHADKHQNLL